MRVLVACEFSGVVRDAFRVRGHEAYSCDLLPADEWNAFHIQGDVLHYLDGVSAGTYEGSQFCDLSEADKEAVNSGVIPEDVLPWDLLIAHPPCTRLTNSGVRWLKVPPPGNTLEQMWEDLESAAKFYSQLRDANIPKKAIENPVMHCYAKQRIVIEKRQVVQPWWFGERAFKATGFELFGLPDLVATEKLIPPKSGTQEHKEWSKVHLASPGPNRWKDRSRTYEGVAKAMAEQWG